MTSISTSTYLSISQKKINLFNHTLIFHYGNLSEKIHQNAEKGPPIYNYVIWENSNLARQYVHNEATLTKRR